MEGEVLYPDRMMSTPNWDPTQPSGTIPGPNCNPAQPPDCSGPELKPHYSNPDYSWITSSWTTPPDPLQVTHVNQTYDLVHSVPVSNVASPTSREWLQNHGIEVLQLTFKDFVDKGKLVGPQADPSTGQASHYVAFNPQDIVRFQLKLNQAMKSYQQRIRWLLGGSRKVFGVSTVKSVAVAVDCSDRNTGYGRMEALQQFLLQLIDEQLSKKSYLYLTSFGTKTQPLWSTCQQINPKTINSARQWVQQLQQQDGCNVLQMLKDIAELKDLDSVILILGSVPDQQPDVLTEFVEQVYVGTNTTIEGVSYDCSNYLTNMCLKNLSEITNGRFHCYSSCCEELLYSGTDISLLVKEMNRVKEILMKIEASKQGMMGKADINIHDEVAADIKKLPQSLLLPQPAGHNAPLNIDQTKFPRLSSAEWLNQHGLKAKQLSLYHVLTPNAFNYHKRFIPVIGKTVQSQVHEKAMVQFQWHDGSMKNVHVDMAQIFDYQKRLGAAVSLYEQRVEWLSTGSRRVFGTISGQRVIILLDLSLYNINYLIHIQHSMRLLLEQQLHNKEYFNIISFGQTSRCWSETMKKPTEENLQSAWKWILASKCEGSRNFLSAFRMAVENNGEINHGIHPDGIYLFTSGVPDQSKDICIPYIKESCIGRGIELHASLFHIQHSADKDPIPSKYDPTGSKMADCIRHLAHCTQGRFHWFRETGIVESDDINCIMKEIEKALVYSKKCSQLTQAVKKKYQLKKILTDSNILPICSVQHSKRPASCVPALMNNQRNVSTSGRPATSIRPASGRPTTNVRPMTGVRPSTGVRPMTNGRCPVSVGNKVNHSPVSTAGSAFNRFPQTKAKSSKKPFQLESLTGIEDYVSTKQWLRRYSLSKLKLNLNKLISVPACKHDETNVKVLQRSVSAKYCNIFPSINVNGTLRHLQLLPHELREFTKNLESVLKYYLHRMQWLLSGSQRVFGTVIHNNSTFLIDTSGSMNLHMDELKKELASLIWEQLYKNEAPFNFISFSGLCKNWQPSIQPATKENCQSAIEWCSHLEAAGSTCTLEALQAAFSDNETKAIYLLTDGKPDSSRSLVLQRVKAMNEKRKIPVNTISFNCSDSGANDFLKDLAQLTAGRYHKSEGSFDINLFIHKLLSKGFQDIHQPQLPNFESDDLNKLSKEIELARTYLSQCLTYRDIYSEFQNSKVKLAANLRPATPEEITLNSKVQSSDTVNKSKSGQITVNPERQGPATLNKTTAGQDILNPVTQNAYTLGKEIPCPGIPSLTTPSQSILNPKRQGPELLNKATLDPTILNLAIPSQPIYNPVTQGPVILNKALPGQPIYNPATQGPEILNKALPSQPIINPVIQGSGTLNKSMPSPGSLHPARMDPIILSEARLHPNNKYQQSRECLEDLIYRPKTNVIKYSELEL